MVYNRAGAGDIHPFAARGMVPVSRIGVSAPGIGHMGRSFSMNALPAAPVMRHSRPVSVSLPTVVLAPPRPVLAPMARRTIVLASPAVHVPPAVVLTPPLVRTHHYRHLPRSSVNLHVGVGHGGGGAGVSVGANGASVSVGAHGPRRVSACLIGWAIAALVTSVFMMVLGALICPPLAIAGAFVCAGGLAALIAGIATRNGVCC
jgi:hypothetical protein